MAGNAPVSRPIAILAGGGDVPGLVAAAAAKGGRNPVVFPITGEGNPAGFASLPVHPIAWGEVGRLFRLLEETGCREAAFVGRIKHRPDYLSVRPDFGAVRLIPRILRVMRNGDDGLLSEVLSIFEENGVRLVGPLDVASDLALPQGIITGQLPAKHRSDIDKAAEAARAIGKLDIGQAAVAVHGRVVAVEDAGGTDELLERVAALRQSGRIGKAGGVLVKCMKPQQDSRLDVPTLGAETAHRARRAGLDGVAAEAGRTLLAGREETVAAFANAGLFLFGLASNEPPGR
jgi:DUF1009 family protein